MTVFDRSMAAEELPEGLLESSPAGESTEPARAAAPVWSPAKRLLFRFGFSYLLLYLLSAYLGLLGYIPYGGMLVGGYMSFWRTVVPWVGKHLFKLDITVFPNGSGDTTYNYLEIFCFALFAVVAALIWTLLDRRRANYARLYEWLRVYIRFGLAMAMMEYGFAKIIPGGQFGPPTLDRLLQPFGDASPMGILWTFMGASTAYTVFAGLTETVGGLLLTMRRTLLLGALVSAAAMANVVMLNFSYDVPVKLYSSHLLAMALFLAAPDLRRLANLFVLNRPVEPADDRPLFARRGLHHGALVFRTVFVAGFAALIVYVIYDSYKTYGSPTQKSPFYGIWNVDELVVDGQVRPPLVTDGSRWRRVVFDYPQMIAIQRMSDTRERYALTLNPARRTLALKKRDDPAWKSTLTYQRPEPGRLLLEGTFDGKKIQAVLRRTDSTKFRLMTRGFHWINEYPFNR
jgi:hypothetical protein